MSTINQLYINKFSLCIVETKTNYVFVWLAYGERWLHGEREPDRDQKNEDPDEKELPVASLFVGWGGVIAGRGKVTERSKYRFTRFASRPWLVNG